LLEARTNHQPTETSTDHQHLHIGVQRCSRHNSRIRIIEQIGVSTRCLEILVVAVSAQSLITFGAVSTAKSLALIVCQLTSHETSIGTAFCIRVSGLFDAQAGDCTSNHQLLNL
jgi:hypothetical protein